MNILITEQQSYLLRRLSMLDDVVKRASDLFTIEYDISTYEEFLNDIVPTTAQLFLSRFTPEEQLGEISEMQLWRFLCNYIREKYETDFKKMYDDLIVRIFKYRVGDINDD